MNEQRKIIYEQRRVVLDGMDVHEQIKAMMKDIIVGIVEKYVDYKVYHVEWDYEGFNRELDNGVLQPNTNIMNPDYVLNFETKEEIIDALYKLAVEQYETKIEGIKNELGLDFGRFERDCLLHNVDTNWMEHIDAMDQLKQGISLVSYAHQDPVLVYRQEGYEMFEQMNQKIQEDVVKILTHAKIEKAPVIRVQKRELNTNQTKPAQSQKKVGRNDPCPCGSGKKYKDCCGK